MVKREVTKVTRNETTVQRVNLKPATADTRKGPKDAWMYPDGKIIRATHLDVKTYYDHKDPELARRKHESNFLITLNTNRSLSSRAVSPFVANEMKQAVKRAVDSLSQDEVLCSYIKFGPKNEEYRNDLYEDVIQSAEWKAGVEVGDIQERVHAHIWLTVHHFSQIQINMPVMQRLFKIAYDRECATSIPGQQMGGGLPYIQVKLLPSEHWAQVVRQYIHKAMESAP